MKPDPRIIEGKRPLTCFDAEEAKQFIGKEGFFTNELNKFSDLNETPKTTLKNIWSKNETYCFITSGTIHKYFLPLEWVKEKEPEPKYRPYKDYDEMSQDFSVGQIIDYIDKDFNCIHQAEIVEVFTNSGGDTFVGIGTIVRTLSGWFQTIEVKDPETDEWVPFGVKE